MVSRLWLWRWLGGRSRRMERCKRNDNNDDNDTSFPSGSTSHHEVHQSLWPCKSFADSGGVGWLGRWNERIDSGSQGAWVTGSCVLQNKRTNHLLTHGNVGIGIHRTWSPKGDRTEVVYRWISGINGWIQWNWIVISDVFNDICTFNYTHTL